ncbi:hypothetical protein V7114_19860 [Neobacillus niacini]|uniref:hypothetical protein n=1 Tax=Neobacillus niacini TaxID=86668 RepID=UPI002FFF44A2
MHTEAVVKEDHNDKVVHVIGVPQDSSGVVLTENRLIFYRYCEDIVNIVKNVD